MGREQSNEFTRLNRMTWRRHAGGCFPGAADRTKLLAVATQWGVISRLSLCIRLREQSIPLPTTIHSISAWYGRAPTFA